MSEFSRFKSGAKRTFRVLGDVLEGAVASGNRRVIVVRNKKSESLFQVSLTVAALVALAVLFLAQGFVLLILVGLGAAYYLGYRAVVIEKQQPPR